jgi:hypothetical protein
MGLIFGHEAKLYFSAAGIGGTPVWTEVPGVRSLKLNTARGEADVSTRGGGGWKATAPTLIDASIDFDLVYDPADAAVVAFESAFFAATLLGLAVMSGPVDQAGSRGLWADCAILKFERDEGLEAALTVAVTAKPTYSANVPEWKEISA